MSSSDSALDWDLGSGDGDCGNAPVEATIAALCFGRRTGVGYRGKTHDGERGGVDFQMME